MGKIQTKPENKHNSDKIVKEFCPVCKIEFDDHHTYLEIKDHIDYCIKQDVSLKLYEQHNINQKEVYIKYTKLTKDNTLPFCYTGQKLVSSNENQAFEKKLEIFKNNIKSIKIDWREGCCTLKLSRDHFLKESINQFNHISIYKELKINFIGEVSYDSGGIIREWFTIIFKELQSEKLNIFEKRIDNNLFSYVISSNITDSKFNREIFNFLGKLFAKAILENITINSCLNMIFFKIILNEKINLNDLIFIDKTLYHSLQELKNYKENLHDLELYFIVNYEKNGVIYTEELIEKGSEIMVTNQNLDLFIERKIEHLVKKDLIFYNEFRFAFLSVIIENYISLFNSDELELIINGQPFIDVYSWKEHSIFQGVYNINHYVIKWFWEIIFKLEQDELGKFLQFCTGTSRVPIEGFGVLESNRGEIAKFCIVSTEYNKLTSNYIKAHTCFNRIDLPIYPSKKQLEDAIKFIIQNEILGFGID